MERQSRVRRAGERNAASSSSMLRLFLIIAVAVACLAAIGTTSVGLRALALAVRGAGSLAGSLSGTHVMLAGAAAAIVLAALFVLRRRRGASPAVPMRRAFRGQAAQESRDREPMMQVSGRSAFLVALQDKVDAHADEGRQLAVHRLDIDRFRQINVRFGGAVGDKILSEVSRRLAEVAGDPVHLARLGDDEFAVIQPETGGARHADIFAARLQKTLEEPIAAGEAEVSVTASIGIAVAPEHGTEAERLLICADLALEEAQQAGHGAVRCFVAAMDERLARRRAVESALRAALKDGPASLELRYQPQWDLGSRRLLAFEVKLRLNDPGLGMVTESELVSAAEAAGLLSAVAERTVREACRTAARWPQHLRIAFNLLAPHCRGRDMAKLLGEALKAYHLSPGRVDLEVAEEIVAAGGEQAAEQLRRLAGMGFRLVLDGYGSGHCSPADLWREAFAAIKIDAGLVGRIGHGEGVEPLVGAMIKLAQALGIEALADGAEEPEQVHFLMLSGCRHVAGPVLGPAVASDKLAAIIDKDAKSAEAAEAGQSAAA
ncbi:MAG TPA: EAL domain-containing protein [Afifellaceae bacterium]|nr:EAL domain-containing protein [Afifellaceae bacterium]